MNTFVGSLRALLLAVLGQLLFGVGCLWAEEASLEITKLPPDVRVYLNTVPVDFLEDPTGSTRKIITPRQLDADLLHGFYLNFHNTKTGALRDATATLRAGESVSLDYEKAYASPRRVASSPDDRTYLEVVDIGPEDTLTLNEQDMAKQVKLGHLRFRSEPLKSNGWYRVQVITRSKKTGKYAHLLVLMKRGETVRVSAKDLYNTTADSWSGGISAMKTKPSYSSQPVSQPTPVLEMKFDEATTLGGGTGGGGTVTPPPSGGASHEVGTLRVDLPLSAKLYVNGELVDQSTQVRVFRTPPLKPNEYFTAKLVFDYGNAEGKMTVRLYPGKDLFIGR